MSDPASPSDSSDPFSSAAAFEEGAGADEARDVPPWDEQDEPSLEELSPSFALSAARLWVQRHQKASMLGAFAVGVFVGSMLQE